MNELVHLRTRRSKTFDRPRAPLDQLLGTVKRRTVISDARAMHWHDGQTWHDVDLAWKQSAGRYVVPSAGYEASFDPDTVTLHYRSRTAGDIKLRLVSIDGVRPEMSEPDFAADGERMRFWNVGSGASLIVVARAEGPEIYRRLAGPTIPTLVWEIDESENAGAIRTNILSMIGVDNYDHSAPVRAAEVLYRNRRRTVEIEVAKTLRRGRGRRRYTLTERLTGRTRWRDPVTRVPEWLDEIAFPVLVDVQIVEETVVDIDDGHGFLSSSTEYWEGTNFDYSVRMNTNAAPAWRFQTVGVPQGSTIDSASLRVNVTNTGDMTAPMYGNNVDAAASWANGSINGPNGMAKTTASITFDGFSSTGNTTRTVTTLIQEIVNRAGFAGGAIRLGCTWPSGSDPVTFRAYDFGGSSVSGQLTIDYTAAGGAGHPTASRHAGVPGMCSTPLFGRGW